MLSFSSLFAILDPIAAVPAFLAMTSSHGEQDRIRTARLACTVAALVLVVFTLVGKWVFKILGISLPAFQLAGSIVLLMVALDMLRGQRSAIRETEEEKIAGLEKDEIAITPLGVPMLAGPGALSTSILLRAHAETWTNEVLLYICIGVVCVISYVVLHVASRSAKWISPIALKITTRIMGLLLASVAVQFAVNAIQSILGHKPSAGF